MAPESLGEVPSAPLPELSSSPEESGAASGRTVRSTSGAVLGRGHLGGSGRESFADSVLSRAHLALLSFLLNLTGAEGPGNEDMTGKSELPETRRLCQ